MDVTFMVLENRVLHPNGWYKEVVISLVIFEFRMNVEFHPFYNHLFDLLSNPSFIASYLVALMFSLAFLLLF